MCNRSHRSSNQSKLRRAAWAGLPFGCALVSGICALPRGASAVATWTGAVSDSWGDASNWLGDPIPPGAIGTGTPTTGQTDVFIGNNSTVSLNGFNFSSGTYTVITRIRLGYAAPGQTNVGTGVLNVNNGMLLTQQFNTIGDGASGILNINGGQFDVHGTDNTKDNVLAFTADSTINISSGTFITGQYGIEQGGAFGTINLTGGQLRLGQLGSATTRAELGAEADFFNFAGGEIFQPRAMTIHQVSGTGSITTEVSTGSTITFDIAGNNTWGGVLNAGTAGVGNLTKNGPGTLTLTALQNYDRATILQNGTLVLDYASSPAILKSVSTISTNGGTLYFKGNSSGQVVTRLQAAAGGSTLIADPNAGATSLSLGSLQRTPGAAVDFRASGASVLGTDVIFGTSTGNNANGIVGAWATVNGTADWAFTQGGVIKAFTGYDTSGALSDATVNYAPAASVAPIGAAVANSVKLTGSNGINLSAGSLVLTSGGILGATTGSVSGGTLTSLNGVGTTTVESDVIVAVPAGGNITVSSGITDNGSGSVGLTKTGPGVLTLSSAAGANTYSGNTYVNGGTLKLGATDVLPTGGTVTLSTDSSIVLDLNGFNQQLSAINAGAVSTSAAGIGTMTPNTGGGQVNVRNGQLTLTVGSNFGGTLAGTGTIVFTGGPSTLSSSASTFSGTIRVTGNLGVTNLGNAASPSPLGQGSSLVIDGGIFRYVGRTNSSTDRLFTVGQAGANLEAYGFSGVNHSGAYGMIRFTNTGILPMANPGNPRTLTLSGNGGTFTSSVSVMESSLAAVIPDAGAGGTVSLTKTGTVQWLLTGASTYTGQTVINGGGTLAVTNLANGGVPSSIGSSGAGTQSLTIDAAALKYVGPGASTNRLFVIGGASATLDSSGTGPLNFTNTGALDGSSQLVLTGANAGANTFAPLISGGSSLLKRGLGVWTVTGANTYTGPTQLDNGTLNVSSVANGGLPSNIGQSSNEAGNLVLNGGALNYTGAGATTDRLFSLVASSTISSSGSGPINFNNPGAMGFGTTTAGRTLNLAGTNTGSNTIAAVIGDAGTGTVTNVTKSGTGTWVLTGANTYTGPTRVNAGRLVLTVPAHAPVLTGPSSGGGIVNGGRLILDYNAGTSPAGAVNTILKSGNAGNHLTGQIRTENAANPGRALGWIDDAVAKQVRIAYTYRGDGDLDGDADGVDIGTWATNFSGELSGGPSATRIWSQGDWDYDGDVDGVDAGLWATNFTGELSGGGLGTTVFIESPVSTEASAILHGLGITVVPEPATLGLLGLGLVGGLARRSRSAGALAT